MNTQVSVPTPEPQGAAAPDAQWAVGLPFSQSLRGFHESLASLRWQELAPSCVFVRDYEGLPLTAPFDIDVMAAAHDLSACARAFTDTARANGLECIVQSASAGINILVLDLSHAPAHRTWAYYEVATHKRLTRDFVVTLEAMTIVRDAGLPVPNGEWRFLINFLQALRKGDLDRYRAVLDECRSVSPDCLALTRNTLELSDTEIADIMAGRPSLQTWQDRLGVTVKAAKQAPPPRRWRNRLRLYALRHFYFLPSKGLYIVTVHGADGVGKSTACDKVAAIFAGYPLDFEAFHHVTSWKKKAPPPASGPQARVSLIRSVLRLGYRVAPEFIRDWWRAATGYHHYARKLNQRVYQGYLDHRIMLLDRYIYDMYLKQRILRAAGPLGRLVGWFNCMIMRRPLCAVLLTDRPDDIIQRKQELNLDEIADYQRAMERLLRQLGPSHAVIDVGGRSRDDIARELARIILRTVGEDIMQLMRHAVAAPGEPTATKLQGTSQV